MRFRDPVPKGDHSEVHGVLFNYSTPTITLSLTVILDIYKMGPRKLHMPLNLTVTITLTLTLTLLTPTLTISLTFGMAALRNGRQTVGTDSMGAIGDRPHRNFDTNVC